jgi:hypothetical protein
VANELKTIASAYGKIHEVQYWGHGDIGAVCIGVKPKQDRLTVKSLETSWSSMNKVMAPDSLFWFRSCSTFRDTEGKEFAKSFSAALGCRVAGHTCIIGAFHGGLVFVDPGQNPSWKDGETGISCAALDMSVKELVCHHGTLKGAKSFFLAWLESSWAFKGYQRNFEEHPTIDLL